MSTMPRAGGRRSRLEDGGHQVGRIFSSRRYGYGDTAALSQTGSRFAMRVDLPDINSSGEVLRQPTHGRVTRTELLHSEKKRRQAMVVERWDSEGLRGSFAAGILATLALVLLLILSTSLGQLISLNQTNSSTRASIATVNRRIETLTADLEEKKADVDVAYQATGLGMVPAKSTTIVALTVPQSAVIGPNGLASAETVSVLLGD